MTDQEIVVSITVAAPPDVVWKALRDPELIRRWHGWDYDGLTEEVETIFVKGVIEEEPGRSFQVSDHDRFTLEEVDGGTTVRITRAPKGTNPEWDDYYEDITEGWTTFLAQLRFAVERHGLAERATVFLEGETGLSHTQLLGIDVGAAGERYTATLPTGDRVTGEVWFTTAHQIGLTVDELGEGLLIAGTQHGNPQRPQGGSMIVLTTYDYPDHAALADRWQQWWKTVQRVHP